MKRCALLVLLALVPAGAYAQTTHRYIVVTRQTASESLRSIRNDDWQPRQGADVQEFRYLHGFAADLTDAEVATLKASKNVRWVEPVVTRKLLSDSITTGRQTTTYGINMVHAADVWSVTKGAALDGKTRIRVAVIDTGIRYTEPDLKAAYKGGHNFIDGTDNPYDDSGHGTHVAGIIAAADDGQGVVGVAPGVDLYGLKVFPACGDASNETVLRAVEWVIAKKAEIGGNWVINLSLGGPTSSDAERETFQRALDAGIVVVAASGNGYDTNPVDGLKYPAAYPSVVSVGAIDDTNTVASFSQRGADLKVVAPGVSVLSTWVSEGVVTGDGRQYGADEMSATNAAGDAICFPRTTITNSFVFCGRGNPADFPKSVAGHIALIERGDLTFAEKAKNAKAAGAIAMIVYNNVAGGFSGTLGNLTSASAVPYSVSMSQADGLAIKATPNTTLTLSFGLEGWVLLDGTSMASPHVAGVAALIWAVAPTASANAVINAVETTATDLGAAGFDTVYGNGLVNALNAAKQLNPSAFGVPVIPAGGPVTGRRPGRRGH
jgi:serine protease